MTDTEKILLLKQMVNDFWEYVSDKDEETRSAAYLEVIQSVLEFGGDDNGE